MRILVIIRTLLLAIAGLGYFANGAQAHVHVASGESLEIMMCSSGMNRVMTINVPSEPAQETDHTACGDCVPAFALEAQSPVLLKAGLFFAPPVPSDTVLAVFPRSPLWPGAPPHGPPTFLKA